MNFQGGYKMQCGAFLFSYLFPNKKLRCHRSYCMDDDFKVQNLQEVKM